MSWNGAAVALVLFVGLATGCSQQKPAEQAVDAAEQALADVHEMALKYIPGQYGEVKAGLDAARRALQDGNYAEAIAAARDLPARAQQLGEAAAAARDRLLAEITVEWTALNETMPDELAALGARLGELADARRLPKGVDRVALEEARSGLSTAEKAWTDARQAHEQGDLERAVAGARAAEQLVVELTASLTPSATAKPAD